MTKEKKAGNDNKKRRTGNDRRKRKYEHGGRKNKPGVCKRSGEKCKATGLLSLIRGFYENVDIAGDEVQKLLVLRQQFAGNFLDFLRMTLSLGACSLKSKSSDMSMSSFWAIF